MELCDDCCGWLPREGAYDVTSEYAVVQDVDTHLQKLAGQAAMKPVLGGKVCNQVCISFTDTLLCHF